MPCVSQKKSTVTPQRERPASTESRPHVDPKKCTIQLGLKGLTVFYRKAIIQAVDTKGQRITFGGAKVAITQGSGPRQVQDKDGTYTFKYTIYGSHIHVEINGTPMKGSPLYPKE